MTRYAGFSDEDLLNRGGQIEFVIRDNYAMAQSIQDQIDADGPKVRRFSVKLGFAGLSALAGIAAAIPTGGWSLLGALPMVGTYAMEIADYRRDRNSLRILENTLTRISKENAELQAELDEINAEIAARH